MAETGGGHSHEEAGGYRWQWRDAVIAVLALGLAGSLWWAAGGRPAAAPDREAGAGEAVGLFEVVVDREDRQWVDLVFDRPVLEEEGAVRVGDVLARPAATIDPALGGFWRWRDRHVLRFEPSGGFAPATSYTVALVPDRFLAEGQSFAGDTELEIKIDQFLVEGVEVWEEPQSEGDAVVLRGSLRFNYEVDPKLLVGMIRLRDPGAEEAPEIELETRWRNETIGFRTTPVVKKKQPRELTLTIDGELTPARGNVPLGDAFLHRLPLGSSEVLEVRSLTGIPGLERSVLRLELSSTVAAELAAPYLKVEPETDYRLSAQRNELVLTGGFRPGETYRVRIDEGLPAGDGATLRQVYDERIRLDNLPPSVAFQSRGLFLSRGGLRNLALESVNVGRLSLAVDRVYRNNLFMLLRSRGDFDQDETYSGGSIWRPLGDRLYEETVALDGERNRKVTTVLSLDDYVDAEAPGLYRIVAGRPDHWQAPQRWLLVTDLGAVAKRGDGEFLVWAVSHRTLEPVAGARVELISDQNQVIGRGTTDGEGLWRFRDAAALAEHEPFLVTLTRGEEFSFLYLDRMRIDTTGLDVGGARRPVDGYTAFLYGERDLYRPGETVRGVALVRDARLAPAPAMPALLRHRDSRGREIQTRRVELDGRGLVEFEWPMPVYAMTGRQSLELEIAETVVGRYGFQLEEFVPDRIKVEIRPPAEPPGPGEALVYDVAGSYLFGPPASGLATESRVRLVDASFTSERFPEFSFRNGDRSFDDRELSRLEARLDEQGSARFTIDLPAERRVPSSLAAVLTARVQEQGGRGVTARTRIDLHPYPYYLGLRRPGRGYPDLGQEVSFDWVALAPDGSDHAAGELEAELLLERWQTVLRRTPAGGFRYESTRESVLVERRKVSGGSAAGSIAFTPREYGSHRVVLTDPATGASATVRFYTGGWGYSPWAVENPDRLELELDREEYRAGETLTVQVRSPFPGRLLLTVEQEQILEVRSYELTGNTATIRLPVRRSFRPNAYLTATLVRPVEAIEPGAVGRAFGAVPLEVERGSNRLEVALEAPAEVRSASRLEVGITSAPRSLVTLAAVDEGILQLIAQRTPDPFDFFYRKLRLGVRSFDTFSLLLPEIEAAKAVGGGVPPGAAQYVRTESIRRVKPVAFFSGVLETDAAGRASAAFELPEFAGALRLMAVAADGERFGSADFTTRVRDPLVLTPTLPRILSLGESLAVPVTLRNDSGRRGSFELTLEMAGAVEAAGPVSRTIELPDGAERTVYFEVATGLEEGRVRFAFGARGNDERAAAEVEVDVRADLPPQATSLAGALTAAETELAAPDASFRPGTVSRRLQVGGLPLVRFARQLGGLLRYPYGCLEQTLSRAFPLLYLDELAREFEPELLDPAEGGADPAELVEDALRRVAYHQLDGGGFSLWRGGREPHPWSSVYATHFLVEAERAGYSTDPQLAGRALDYLRGLIRAKDRYGSHELERAVYALYVLSRAGEPELGVMDFLRERQSRQMTRASRALLAAAYAGVGNRDAVAELAAALDDVEQVERDTGRNFRSTVRDRALLLLALQEAAPESAAIPRLLERLGRDTAGHWTTQESAFTLVAIGQLVKRQAERPPFAGTLWVGDRQVGRFTSEETAVFDDLGARGAVRIVMEPGYEPGSAYYTLTTRGIPRDAAYRPLAEGLEVARELLDREGKRLDPQTVRQGDLVVLKTRVRSVAGPVDNVVLEQLLPSGLEVENARLKTTESLPWISGANLRADSVDLRDDRVLIFTRLPANQWQTVFSLTRAVAPGSFRLPPVHAEAMYNPALRASGERGRLEVGRRQ